MAKKSVWDDADKEIKKLGAIIEQIKRGLEVWQKPWKPGDLLKPINVDIPFYLGRLKRPERLKKPEGSDG